MNAFNAGKHINQGYYRSFQPDLVNRDWQVTDMQVLALLSKADRSIGKLDMYSKYVSVELYLRMHIAKEATQSSKIEGTRTNMQDAFLEEAAIAFERRSDWDEVQNYITAIKAAVAQLDTLPVSTRLIKQMHRILMRGVRGESKMLGEFRKSQNWIGGVTLNDAAFIPPVHTSIDELMSDIEKFANSETNLLPDLIKIAIIHYQFETIHPFLDGNGRVGRLLITLMLVDKGLLQQPILYLSDFFERNRTLYYDNLTRARTNNDITGWIKFFLVGVIEIADKGVTVFDGILQLQNKIAQQLQGFGKRGVALKAVIDYLYTQPVVNYHQIAAITNKSKATNYKIIAELETMGIIKSMDNAQRNQIWVFEEYVGLF